MIRPALLWLLTSFAVLLYPAPQAILPAGAITVVTAACNPCSPTFFTKNTADFNSNVYATLSAANKIRATGSDDNISSSQLTLNYWGGCTFLYAGSTYRAIIVFDLTQIPSTATVSAVEFWMQGETYNVVQDATVYRLTSGPITTANDAGVCETDSDSTAVDWTNRTGSTAWSTLGGDYDGTALTVFSGASDITNTWIKGTNAATCGGGSADCLVEAVQGIVGTSNPNYGLIIIGGAGYNRWKGNLATDGVRPYLKVSWS